MERTPLQSPLPPTRGKATDETNQKLPIPERYYKRIEEILADNAKLILGDEIPKATARAFASLCLKLKFLSIWLYVDEEDAAGLGVFVGSRSFALAREPAFSGCLDNGNIRCSSFIVRRSVAQELGAHDRSRGRDGRGWRVDLRDGQLQRGVLLEPYAKAR